MELDFRNLPTGSLPYDSIKLCKQMMLRLYEEIPFLPELPLLDANDTVFNRTLANIPCITFKDGKLLLPDSNDNEFMIALLRMDKVYNSQNPSDFEKYYSETPFLYMYIEILKRIKPKFTVINLLGPFSFANSVFNKNAALLLTNNEYRKFIIDTITIKALWFIYKVKTASPGTTPIILFEENLLYKFGTLKRTNENITKETVTTLLEKVFLKVKHAGAMVGVQSFEKCNWQLIFDTNCVDLISFDAYNNPNNLNIIASSVNKFVARGGYINWGFVPVMNETVIRTMNAENLYLKLISTIEDLAVKGVSLDSLYKNLTISVQGDMDKYPILFAEKALMIANKIGKKIPLNSII